MRLLPDHHSKSSEGDFNLNLSPLLDIVFILLIFFVITSSFSRESGVEVKKPRAVSASDIKDHFVKVVLTREGSIQIFERKVNFEELAQLLKHEKSLFPKTKLIIVADEKSTTEYVVKIIDLANRAGIDNTSLSADRS